MATESRRQNPFVVSGQGQEATQIGMAYAMKEETFFTILSRFSVCYIHGYYAIRYNALCIWQTR